MPIPGMITKWATEIQNARMKKTDARVDVVTESIGALRIIKMFGWEERIKSRISAKREEELDLTWKRRLMDLYVAAIFHAYTQAQPLCEHVFAGAHHGGYFCGVHRGPEETTHSFDRYVRISAASLMAVFTSMLIFESLKGVMGLVSLRQGSARVLIPPGDLHDQQLHYLRCISEPLEQVPQ